MTFINFSGGLDSTYFLYKWLLENKAGGRILVHHCLYSKNRNISEGNAVKAILNEFKAMGLTNFVYNETKLDFLQVAKPDRDVVVMATMGAFVARHHHIDKVLLCYSKEESAELHSHLLQHGSITGFKNTHRYSVANRVFQDIYRHNKVDFYFYNQEQGLVSRLDMIKELPDNILSKVSFCRLPKQGKPFCGVCPTCKMTIPYLKQQNKLKLWNNQQHSSIYLGA